MEEKKKRLSKKSLATIIAVAVVVVAAATMGVVYAVNHGAKYVKAENLYGYTNQDPKRASADDGFSIDGVFDEQVYKDNTWLYLHNENGSSKVDLAITSYYGENGMYFAFDDTETTPIYINSNRRTELNSGVELYLAPDGVTSINGEEDIFEIDLLADGQVNFKRRAGNNSWVNVASSNDIMAYLGTTLKGGAANTEECYGYTMEFFIPWDYLEYLGLDVSTVKKSHMWVNPAHITSYNYSGTDSSVDRYWYSFAKQKGGDGWNNVTKYYRFNEKGAMDTVPVTLVEGEHYTITGSRNVIVNMKAYVTITPEKGYAISSVLCNGEEKIKKVSYNEDGSVLAVFKGPENPKGLTISAEAEKVTEGPKTLKGQVNLKNLGGSDSLIDLWIACVGPKGETQITPDKDGRFELRNLEQGYYTIQAEKKGYYKLTKGIYLNRDIDTDIDMEYEMFTVESGYSWDIESQNDGKLFQWGGAGAILTTNSYDSFYIESNFWYDPMQPSIADDDHHVQQRAGFRVKFNNSMYLNSDIMLENGTMKIQYGKIMGDHSLYNWNTVYTLTEDEIAKFKRQGGIRFGLMREGQYVLLYLDNKLVRVENLGDEYKSCKAQVGFESYSTASYTMNYEFKYNGVKIPDDIINATNLEEGRIMLPAGGHHEFLLPGNYVNMNLVLKAMDHPEGSPDPRTDVLLKFANGKAISFGIAKLPEGTISVQSTNAGLNPWKNYGNLTEKETTQYQTTAGVQLRIVRDGTTFYLFVGDRMINTVNLSKYIGADTAMTVTIRHYDDMGARIDIPFNITKELPFFLYSQDWETTGTESGTLIAKPQEDDKKTELVILKKFADVDLKLKVKDTNYPNENRTDVLFKFNGGESVSYGINSRSEGTVIVQSTPQSISGWKTHGTLTSAMIEKFRTEGVDFRIVRKGTLFYLVVEDSLIATCDLSEYISADEETTIAIRYFGDGGERHEIPFAISGTVTDETIADFQNKSKVFVDNVHWDLSRDSEGIISLANGGIGANLQFLEKYTDIDLTVRVQDHPEGTGEPRTTVIMEFDNGESIRFSVVNQNKPFLQTSNGTLFKWKGWGDLIEDEVAQYMTAEGIDYRIVREGTTVYQLIADRLVATCDLSEYIEADTAATVYIRHDGDTGTKIEIPFAIANKVQDTKVTIEEADNGSVTSEKSGYSFGESIVLKVQPAEGYQLKKLMVNGEDKTSKVVGNQLSLTAIGENILVVAEFERIVSAKVSFKVSGYKLGKNVSLAGKELKFEGSGEVVKVVVGEDGMVSATLALGSYTISAEGYISNQIEVTASGVVDAQRLNYRVFKDNAGWDLTKQNDGVISLANGGNGGWLYFYDKYKEMDLTLRVKDDPSVTSFGRTSVVYEFGNGQTLDLSVVNEANRAIIQMRPCTVNSGWKALYVMSVEERAKFTTTEGIQWRLAWSGTQVKMYLDGELRHTVDLAEFITAGTETTVKLRHDDDAGIKIDIPFTLKMPVMITSERPDLAAVGNIIGQVVILDVRKALNKVL